MKIIQDKKNPNIFKVESTSRKGVFYKVNLQDKTCSCPQFVFRGGKYGRECKHLALVEQNFEVEEKPKTGKSKEKQVIKYLKEKGSEELIFLKEKFGDDIINDMLAENIIIEEHGKVRLL